MFINNSELKDLRIVKINMKLSPLIVSKIEEEEYHDDVACPQIHN